MARKGSVRVSITGDDSGLGRATRDAENKLDRLNRAGGRAMRGLGTAAKAGGIALAAGLAYGLKESVDAAVEAERAMAQTRAVIKSTGGVANVTVKDITDLASAISLKSGIDDEAIQSGANMLLTFKNLRNEAGAGNDIFSQSTQIIADMSVALGKDLKPTAIQVGKALNDPNVGLTALSRSGVTFTEQQKETIKSLFDSGEQMKAQKMILRELNKEFGGSAEAAGDTFSGQIDKAKVSLEETEEVIGAALLPGLAAAAEGIAKFVTEIRSGKGAGGDFADAVKDYAEIVKAEWDAIAGAVRAAVEFIGDWLRKNRDDIKQVGQAFENIGKAIKFVFEQVILPVAKRVFPAVIGVIKGAVKVIGGIVKVFSGIFTGDFRQMWDGVKDIFSGGVKTVLNFLRGMTAPMREVGSRIGDALKNTLGGAFNGVKTAVRAMRDVVKGVFHAMRDVVKFVIGKIIDAIDFFLAGIEKMVDVARKLPFIGDKFDGVAEAIRNARGKLQNLKDSLDGVPDKSKKLNPLISRARDVARSFQDAASAVENTVDWVRRLVRESPKLPKNIGRGFGPQPGSPGFGRGARGGQVDQPTFLVGEEAPRHPEFVIATNPQYRKKNMGHLADAARALGVPGFAAGGRPAGFGNNAFPIIGRGGGSGERDRLEELVELMRQQVANQNQLMASMKTEKAGWTAALAGLISGQIGGQVGLSFQTPSAPGRLASY